jgi:CRP-like cAMP-binding protein
MTANQLTAPAAADGLEALFAGLPRARRRLCAGDVLFHAGDPGDAAQLVLSGLVGLEIGGLAREPMIALLFGAGELVAIERVLLPGSRHEATARAVTACEVQLVRRDDIEAADAGGTVRLALAGLIARQTTSLLRRVVESAHHHASARVAGALCVLARDDDHVTVTQDVVAAAAGVTRVTANAELRRLAERGLVRLERKRITLVDRRELERRAR